MSLASVSFQTVYLADSSSVTVSLLGNNGDLFQMYDGPATSPSGVIPSWNGLAAGSRPYLRILMTDSLGKSDAELASMVSDANTQWYVDGKRIVFGSNNVSVDGSAAGELKGYAGKFRKLTAAAGSNHMAGAPFGGLEIMGDLVTPTGGLTVSITVKVALTVGSQAVYAQGSTSIRMIKKTGSGSFATIYCDNNDSFSLDKDNPSVICRVRCWNGSAEMASGSFRRRWYLLVGGAWVKKAETETFTVDQDMIDTFGDVKVECLDSAGDIIATDIQTVADMTDSYIVSPNPVPADGTIRQSDSSVTGVKFTPSLSHRDGSAGPACKFLFTVMDSVGNIQNSDSSTKYTVYTVPRSTFESLNEGPVVNITAVEP